MASGVVPRSVLITAIVVLLVTSIAWIVGVSSHRFLWREFWLYVGIFLLPALMVIGSAWMIVQERLWLRVLGFIGALPSIAIWGISLLLVWAGFKIH